jgi:hypothetical protein
MTTLREGGTALSGRALRVGPEHTQVAPYAGVPAARLAYRNADPHLYVSAEGVAVLVGGLPPSASMQFVGADDPRQVLFDPKAIVSASALAGAAMVASTGIGVAVIDAYLAQHALSGLYGSPVEREREVTALTTSAAAVTGEYFGGPFLAEADDDLLNWETPIAIVRRSGGRVLVHMRERSRRPFRLVSDD